MITDHPERLLRDIPFAVFDFETTGLSAARERVIEVAVVHVRAGAPPELVYDTVIHPQRPVSATHVHGITDADVVDAPPFADVAAPRVSALAGTVLAAWNASFDIGFLAAELQRLGVAHRAPNICLNHIRPSTGIGPRCRLQRACEMHAIPDRPNHRAAADALVTADLLALYLETWASAGVHTVGDLCAAGGRPIRRRLGASPLPDPHDLGLDTHRRFPPRHALAGDGVADRRSEADVVVGMRLVAGGLAGGDARAAIQPLLPWPDHADVHPAGETTSASSPASA